MHAVNSELKSLKVISHEKIGKILFETSPDMLAILDCDGKIMDCNKHLEENTYYKKNELIGLVGPVDLVFEDDIESAVSAFEELKITNIKPNIPLRMKRKDNSTFFSIWSGVTLRNEFNELEGYLVTGKDISYIQELENKLTASKKQHHQEKLALIGKLSSRLAHDIKNPLSVIQITFENLKMMYGTDNSKHTQFEKIQRAIFRISHQIDDVLDFINKQPLTLNKTKLSHVIINALDSLYIPNNITLKLPKNDVELICDPMKLSVVFVNLILNGFQSVDDKGAIEIRLKENTDDIVIEVEDSGKGIPKENLDKVFEPLFTTKQTGTGLGLASVKAIIESHGGTISVTSSPTIFTITLPKRGD